MSADTDSPALDVGFMREVIATVEDLGELKVTLHVLLQTAQQGTVGIRLADLVDGEVARTLVSANQPEPAGERVRRSIERALANGRLLRLRWESDQGPEVRLYPGTAQNRRLVEQLRAGDEAAGAPLGLPPDIPVTIFRPNVFAVYEQYIGPLTPLVAEHLRDAEQSYPREWLEDAIRAAAEYNRRNWRYIQAILNEWERTGAPDGITRRHS